MKTLVYNIGLSLLILITVGTRNTVVYAISLADVSESAVAHSVELQKQAKRIEALACEVTIATSELYPRLDAQYSASYTDYAVSGRDPLANINVGMTPVLVYPFQPSRYKNGADITLTQILFAGGKIMATIDLAKSQLEQSKIDYQIAQDQLLSSVAERYWKWICSIAEVNYYKSALDKTVGQNQSAQVRQQEGQTTPVQDLELGVLIANVTEDLLNAQTQSTAAQKDLEKITHLSLSTSQNISIRSSAEIKKAWQRLNGLSGIQLEQQKQVCVIEGKKLQQRIQDSRFFPEISFQSAVNYFNLDNSKFSFDHLNYGNLYAGVTVQWNIFNGFKDLSLSRKSKLETEIAELELTLQQDTAAIELSHLTTTVETAIKDVDRTERSKLLAEKTYEVQAQKYSAHQLSKNQLADSKDLLQKSVLNYTKAAISAEMALINWSKEKHVMLKYMEQR
ncbi:TolC family protein [bacterium]|nr:TolC family protein [bacterium]